MRPVALSQGYWQAAVDPFARAWQEFGRTAFPTSVQLSLPMSFRHWLAALLLKLFPEGQLCVEQESCPSRALVQVETDVEPKRLQDDSLLQTVLASELHAADGELVSLPLHAPTSSDKQAKASAKRIGDPSQVENPLHGKPTRTTGSDASAFERVT